MLDAKQDWIYRAKVKANSGKAMAVLEVPGGGYQMAPLEYALAKCESLIVFRTDQEPEIPVTTLAEYVQGVYEMGCD